MKYFFILLIVGSASCKKEIQVTPLAAEQTNSCPINFKVPEDWQITCNSDSSITITITSGNYQSL